MKRFTLALMLALGACGHIWPTPTRDACSDACANLKKLGCAHQDACYPTCVEAGSPEFAKCNADADSCAAADRCDL